MKTTDGTSALVLLGSGTAIPLADRTSSGHLVRRTAGADRGRQVLLDSGAGTAQRLARIGVRLDDLDAVLYTHFHPDHTLDYASIAFAFRNPTFGKARRDALPIFGPLGLRDLLARFSGVYGDWVEPVHPRLDVREVPPGTPFRAGPFEAVARKTLHTPESQGYRLVDADGATFAYSGDSDECDGLVELARDADLFLCECSFLDAAHEPGHLTPSRAARIAARAGARKLVLTHFYPECAGDAEAVRREARSAFSGEIVVGSDGLEIPFSRSGRRS